MLVHVDKMYRKGFLVMKMLALKAITHTMQICGIFDIANLWQYRAGFAPMLFQWSHSHMQCFSLQIFTG